MVCLLTVHGLREARDVSVAAASAMSALVAAFGTAVENAMPGLAPLHEVLEALNASAAASSSEADHRSLLTMRFVAASARDAERLASDPLTSRRNRHGHDDAVGERCVRIVI